nr:hypothetical protein [Actinomycetota bacterium]
MTPGVAIGAGLSSAQDAQAAGRRAAQDAVEGLAGDVDLAFLFLSAEHVEEAGDVAQAVRETASPRHLVG